MVHERDRGSAQLSSNLLFCVRHNLHLIVNLNVYDGFLCMQYWRKDTEQSESKNLENFHRAL